MVGGFAEFVGAQPGGVFGQEVFGALAFVGGDGGGQFVEEAVDLADVAAIQQAGGHPGGGGRKSGWQGFAGDRGAGGGVLGVADAEGGFGFGDPGDAGQGAGQGVAEFGGGGLAVQSGDQRVFHPGQPVGHRGDRGQRGQPLAGVQGVQPRPGQRGDRGLHRAQRRIGGTTISRTHV